MPQFSRFLLLALIVALAETSASAQVTTGTPPFSSNATNGSVDTINLANLNAHLTIPVLQTGGRGVPFYYGIDYDNSVWQPTTASGTTTWEPTNSGSFGWNLVAVGEVRLYSYTITGYCYTDYPPPIGYIETGVHYGLVYEYVDTLGTSHYFPGEVTDNGGSCGTGYSGSPGTATDGSGYTMTVNSSGNATVTARNGTLVYFTNSSNTYGVPVATDTNGNEVTENSSGQFYDTLSSTTPVLTVAGVAPSNTTFTYTPPSGTNVAYTMKYTSYTVRTNFGCSGITEYGATAQNLVSEIDLPDGTKYTFTYEPTPSYSGDVTGRLASVTLPTGGTISYTYTGGSNGIVCADGSTATLGRQTPDGTWSYAHSESGTAWTTTITAPTYNSQNNQTVINFQGIYQTEQQVYQGSSSSGTLLKTTYTCYNGSASPCNSTAITLPITQRTHIIEWPGTSGLQSKTVTSYNSYGLVTEKDEYAYGPGAPGSVVRKTLTTYASLTNGIVNRPASVTVEDSTSSVHSQSTYTYDQGSVTTTSGTPQHVSVTGSRGNATTISRLVSGSTTLSEMFTYYDTGNVNVATDVNGAQTTYTYGPSGCPNSFPTSVSEPLSLSRSMTWNCTGGVETSVTDENSQSSSVGYTDADFWRPNSTTDQLSNVANLAYSGQKSAEMSMLFNSSSSTSDLLETVDGLGRLNVAQIKEAPGSSTYDSVEEEYDSLGRSAETTLPYAAASGGTCSGTCPATSTTYDPLGRPATITDGGGGTLSYTYNQNDSYRTAGPAPSGENAKRKQLEYDALGRLTSVCEVTSITGGGTCAQTNSAIGFWTKYTYDVNNNLIGVTQNAQSSSTQSRTYAYDDLGRMTSEINPENATTMYTYDTDSTCGTSKGDLVKKIDAVGDTICFAYDALHRMTSTTYSGTYASVTPNRYFYYDSATVDSVAMVNVKSRMAEAYTCFSPCSTKITDIGLSYTARGEVSDVYESTPHSGGYYHSSASYWANGVLSNLNGALGYTTNYSVDGEGRVYSAGSGSELTSTSYNTASLPTAVNFASGDSDTFTYDPDTNRMTQYNFNVNGSSVVGKLTWNPVGTLASLAVTDPFDSSDAQTCSYTHDDLSRIASANCGSIWSQTFSYDVFGNINKSGSSSFGATYSSSTNRMTLIGSSTPSYDSNGNVTNDFLNSYAWDANGRPVTANGVGLTYDALGRMAEQNTSGVYTQIQYSPTGFKMYIMKSGATLVKAFVPLPAGTAEVWSANMTSPYYRHSDWLGSSRLASSSGRTVLFDGAYGPFGEPYAQSGTSDLSFTGQNEDTSSNLYDFPAREYGTQGRWPSPDPAGIASVDRRDPQSWNRYAYVRNNPLELIDPTGLYVPAGDDDDDDDDDDGGGSGGVVGGGGGGDAGIGSGSVATGGNDGGPCPGSSALCETSVGCPWPLCAPIFLPPPPPPLSDLLLPFPYIPLGGSIPMPGGCTNYVMKDCGASSDGQKPKSLCFAGNSLKDKAVRTFSLLRLAETWREWVFGAGAKITFFNVAQAGARSAGGPESLGSAAIGSAGEALGTAGTAATIAATAADVSCHVGVPLIFPNIIPTF
jgi:RHS repeat-associated protein